MRALRWLRIQIRPQLFAGNASDALNLDYTFGWHAPPLVNSAMRDAKRFGQLQLYYAIFGKGLFDVHDGFDSTAII